MLLKHTQTHPGIQIYLAIYNLYKSRLTASKQTEGLGLVIIPPNYMMNGVMEGGRGGIDGKIATAWACQTKLNIKSCYVIVLYDQQE